MTQEQKDLLLKDLCARLPYGVKVNNEIQGDFVIYGVSENYIFARTGNKYGWINHVDFHIEKVKPYLFPMSSMTEEQKQYLKNRFCYDWNGEPYDSWKCQIEIGDVNELIDFFHKNHLDYHNLIPKGSAIDATGLSIY